MHFKLPTIISVSKKPTDLVIGIENYYPRCATSSSSHFHISDVSIAGLKWITLTLINFRSEMSPSLRSHFLCVSVKDRHDVAMTDHHNIIEENKVIKESDFVVEGD